MKPDRNTRLAPQADAQKVGERSRRVILSDDSVDRWNTTIASSGWQLDNFRKNPVMMFEHQRSGDGLPIGKFTDLKVENGALKATAEFFDDELAPGNTRLIGLLDAGVMGFSVRFDPGSAKFVYNPARERGDFRDDWMPPLDYSQTELLEASVVGIMGNANAVPEGERALPADLAKLVESAKRAATAGKDGDTQKTDEKKPAETETSDQAEQDDPAEERAEGDAEETTAENEVADDADVDLEGMTKEELVGLINETVQDALAQEERGAALRSSGTIETA